jgi:hypothetical protein
MSNNSEGYEVTIIVEVKQGDVRNRAQLVYEQIKEIKNVTGIDPIDEMVKQLKVQIENGI